MRNLAQSRKWRRRTESADALVGDRVHPELQRGAERIIEAMDLGPNRNSPTKEKVDGEWKPWCKMMKKNQQVQMP